MLTTKLTIMAAAVVVTGGAWLGGTGTSLASSDSDPVPFLCPVVGEGAATGAENSGPDHGPTTFGIADGTSFIPGNNQAGPNVDSNAVNTLNPDVSGSGPGGNPDYSPIWPGF